MIDAAPLNVMDESPCCIMGLGGESPTPGSPPPPTHHCSSCKGETHALCPTVEEQSHIQFKSHQ